MSCYVGSMRTYLRLENVAEELKQRSHLHHSKSYKPNSERQTKSLNVCSITAAIQPESEMMCIYCIPHSV